MTWLLVAAAIGALSVGGIVWVRQRSRRAGALIVPVDLADRVAAATRAFVRAEPWRPASAAQAPEAAAAIEAALIARDVKRALELAETALAASPDAAPPRVWLAWALCANSQPGAALDQLRAAATEEPLARYLTARAEHLRFEHAAGAVGAVPPLVTTGDLAVVTLARSRGGAAWLTGGPSDAELSSAEIKAAVAEHREVTARCLAQALAALAAEPGFIDAAYLVARLAVKAGFLDEATALFDALAPHMPGRPDAETFERDRRDLADPTAAVANARQRPPSTTAKRSRSLKVLS